MLKYYFDKKEITNKEYENFLVKDACHYGNTKSDTLRVVKENKQEARKYGKSIWHIMQGNVLTIRKE